MKKERDKGTNGTHKALAQPLSAAREARVYGRPVPAATRLLIAVISRAQIVRQRWTEKEKRLGYSRVGAT